MAVSSACFAGFCMSLKPLQRDSHTQSVVAAVICSLLLHLPVIWGVGQVRFTQEPYESSGTQKRAEGLALSLIEDPEKPKKDKEETESKMQYVSADAPEVEKRPEVARFVDQYDSTTNRETVRKALPGAPAAQVQRTPEPAARITSPVSRPVESKTNTEQVNERDRPRDEGDSGSQESRLVLEKGQASPSRLFPKLSDSRLASPVGEGGSLDYLRDVDEGEKTLLNRKQERYWAFFDRVKIQIAEQYSAGQVYRKRDPYGNIYGVKDRYSVIRVTLNSDGTVRQLHVSRPSGLDFVDDEAVRSVREAAPFHNPPEGLKDEDGLIHFSFGFYLEVTAEPSFRLFR